LGTRPEDSDRTVTDPGISIVLSIVAKAHKSVTTDLLYLLIV
jgi:hypothetical protein